MAWVTEGGGVVSAVEGETKTYSVEFKRATLITDPSMVIYKSGSDVTATLCPSGSVSVSGNIVTLKPISFPVDGGATSYVLALSAIVDGQTRVGKAEFAVSKKKDPR